MLKFWLAYFVSVVVALMVVAYVIGYTCEPLMQVTVAVADPTAQPIDQRLAAATMILRLLPLLAGAIALNVGIYLWDRRGPRGRLRFGRQDS